MITEPPKRGRGRPPGSKNKIKREKPKSKRVERRKAGAQKAPPRPPAPPKPVQVEICLPGETFGMRPQAGHDLPDLPEYNDSQMVLAFPRPRGRPEGTTILRPDDENTLQRIWQCGWEQADRNVLAVALGVSPKTLRRFFDAHPEVEELYLDAGAAGRGRLGIQFYREAMSGNTPVLMQAAKGLLGIGNAPKEEKKGDLVPLESLEAAADECKRLILDFVKRSGTRTIPG